MTRKTTAYDAAEYLDTAEAVTIFMEEALETNDPAFITHCLGVIARSEGMSEVASKTGLSRESLYRALSKEGNPEFATIIKVLAALGLRLTVSKAA
jgi:probable addiction module antidote protein